MNKIIIPQYKLLVIASAIKSENLLYIAATSLSQRKANKIIEVVLAIDEGPQSVVSDDYEVDFHTTYGAHSSYILKINCSR